MCWLLALPLVLRGVMSEDEFVVLLEHAGIVETADDSEREFVEQAQLLAWLEREGIELFTSPAVLASRATEDSNSDASGHASVAMGEARTRLANRVLERLLAREWLAPIQFNSGEGDSTVRLWVMHGCIWHI